MVHKIMQKTNMTPDNDVNAVFEKHLVKEIESILTKMRSEIERKKEDLRIMVGERYRDLIEAADTIEEMQNSSEKICNNIQKMEGLCGSLQQRGLIGFKTKEASKTDSFIPFNKGYQYSIAVQVKLLVTIPEILWELTENKNYLDAAQLLLVAQQCHTALHLSTNAPEVLNNFPVVSRQWASISQFRSSIIHGCINLVTNENKDFEQTLGAMTSIILIEGITMEAAFKKFLHLRKSSIQSCLNINPSTIAKNQLVDFVLSFISSFSILNYLFVADAGKKCMLELKVLEISGGNLVGSESSMNNLPVNLIQESPLALSFLPKSILEFRPKPQKSLSTLDSQHIKKEINKWLSSVIMEASETTAKLLSCITSIKSLSLIRNSILEAKANEVSDENWEKLISKVTEESNFSPWEMVVREEALKRAKYLIQNELQEIKSNIIQMVKDVSDEIRNNAKVCQEEGDVTEFLWSESLSDLPDQIMWSAMTSRNAFTSGGKIGLFYKCRGFTPTIQNICKTLNRKLTALLDDLAYYATKETTSKPSDDYNILLKYMEEETLKVFKEFLCEIEEIANQHYIANFETVEYSLDSMHQRYPFPEASIVVTIGRLCQAIPVVCQQLKVCSNASHPGNLETVKGLSLGLTNDTKTWLELNEHFAEKATLLISKYLSTMILFFGKRLRNTFRESFQECTAQNLLYLHPTWEKVFIEEENECGTKIETFITVPSSPTPALCQILMEITKAINLICAHNLPRASHTQLVEELNSELISVYEDSGNNANNLNQATALQLLFDLKVIQNILLPRENKEMNGRISSMIQSFESHVDPFDLDVVLPYLTSRVKMASQRLLVLLGTVTPTDKQPLTLKGSATSSRNSNLPIVPPLEIPRFSNVPLPSSATFQKSSSSFISNSVESSFKSSLDDVIFPQASCGSSEQGDIATARSSKTSSIFSAMSTSWFG